MSQMGNGAIPAGSTVVVTGANGFVGSHIVDQFLSYGYKVRGTVRNPDKNAWLPKLFEKKYGSGSFELAAVPDLEAEGALSGVVKGASVLVHCATIASLDPDPNKVIPGTIAMAVNTLKTAYSELSVKRYVLTSSSSAAVLSRPGVPGIVVGKDTWNDAAIVTAWAKPPYEPERTTQVYAASKAQSEQEVWKYHNDHRSSRPDLVVNTILPNLCFGRSLDPVNQGHPSTSGWLAQLFNNNVGPIHSIVVPQYYIDVQDVGRLHVAAVVLTDVENERIFGFAERFCWDKALDIFRKSYPNRRLPDDFSGGDDPNVIEPRARGEELLRKLGRSGWTPLEDSVLANVEDLV